MTTTLTYTATEFTVAPSGFSTQKRFLRATAFGPIGLSGGRTFSIGLAWVNTGQPWLGYRFDMDGLKASIDFVSTTVSGNTQTQTLAQAPAVSPVIERCTL